MNQKLISFIGGYVGIISKFDVYVKICSLNASCVFIYTKELIIKIWNIFTEIYLIIKHNGTAFWLL